MESDQPIRVELTESGTTGTLVEVDQRRIQVRFESDDAPFLCLGTPQAVMINMPFPGRSIPSHGRILLRIDDEGAREYRIELEDNLERVLQQRHTRRSAFRVRAEPGAPISITVRPIGEPGGVLGEIDDLSVLGVSVWISESAEAELVEATDVELRFRLPDSKGSIRVRGKIHYRRIQANHVQLGLSLDLEATQRGAQIEEELTRYVMKRQLSQLRGRVLRG